MYGFDLDCSNILLFGNELDLVLWCLLLYVDVYKMHSQFSLLNPFFSITFICLLWQLLSHVRKIIYVGKYVVFLEIYVALKRENIGFFRNEIIHIPSINLRKTDQIYFFFL